MLSAAAGACAPVRPVRIITTGGTIAMAGEQGARPQLDAQALVASAPGLAAFPGLEAIAVLEKPSPHLTLDDQLAICLAARDAAREGIGVVVTHGTDTLEETATLCDLLHDAQAPVVFTGAIRPASAAGADGPGNLLDAVAVASGAAAAGMGVLVVFGGEIHHARCARKGDATSLTAFSSPQTGPLGRVTEGRPAIWSRLPRSAPLDPPALDRHVPIVPATAGDDGRLARAVLASEPDGAVAVTLGGGHLAPDVLALWAQAAQRIPVVACSRPERGSVLRETYGYAGSEQQLRATPIVPAGFLSPQAARMKLIACLGAGLDAAAIRDAFAPDDL